MLARLDEIDGVEAAEVDRHGELLRVRLAAAGIIEGVIRTLDGLGFAADEIGDGAGDTLRWYGANTVLELSREEANAIARRVGRPFAQRRGIDADRVETAVANALYACFADHAGRLRATVSLRAACPPAVEIAVRPIVGDRAAKELARAIEEDLAHPSGA